MLKNLSFLYKTLALSVITLDQIFICYSIFGSNFLAPLFWSSIVPVFLFSFFTKNKNIVMGPSIPIMLLVSQLLMTYFNSLEYLLFIPVFTTFFLILFFYSETVRNYLVFNIKFLPWFIVATAMSILWKQVNIQYQFLFESSFYYYLVLFAIAITLKPYIQPLITMMVSFSVIQLFNPVQSTTSAITALPFAIPTINDLPLLISLGFFVSFFIILDLLSLTDKPFDNNEKKWFIIGHLFSLIPSAPSVVKTTFNKEINGNYLVILATLPALFLFYYIDFTFNKYSLSLIMVYVFSHLVLKKITSLANEPFYIIFGICIFLKFYIYAISLILISQIYQHFYKNKVINP